MTAGLQKSYNGRAKSPMCLEGKDSILKSSHYLTHRGPTNAPCIGTWHGSGIPQGAGNEQPVSPARSQLLIFSPTVFLEISPL